jgi:hypothetical protein
MSCLSLRFAITSSIHSVLTSLPLRDIQHRATETPMDIDKLTKLIELVEASGISELEISEGEESVRISRTAPNVGYPMMQQAYAAPIAQPSVAAVVPAVTATEAPAASGNQWPHRTFPNGWYFLPHPEPGRESLHRNGSES